jgi:hypothetical protein
VRFRRDGSYTHNHLFWSQHYFAHNVPAVMGLQTAFLALAERICNLLNVGIPDSAIREVICDLPGDFPGLPFPDGWFYWGSSYVSGDEGVAASTVHYIVDSQSASCLVWAEDSYVELVSCEDVGINWREVSERPLLESDNTKSQEMNTVDCDAEDTSSCEG